MENPHQVDRPDLILILENFGRQVCETKNEFLSSIVTSTSVDNSLIDFTLYIFAPEISYEYRVINVEYKVSKLKIKFFTLSTKQSEHYDIDISSGTILFQNKLNEIQNFRLFKAALNSLINQTLLKREYRDAPIRNKIVPGQARVAILIDDQRINVGWIRIEGDEVFYYTGQGLREIFKPNMTEDEKKKSAELQKLTEEELISEQYISKRKLTDFKDIV